MTTIYLVSRGEYSDYRITAAFSTEAAADKAIADGLGDAILPIIVDRRYELHPDGKRMFTIVMGRDGEVESEAIEEDDIEGIPEHKWESEEFTLDETPLRIRHCQEYENWESAEVELGRRKRIGGKKVRPMVIRVRCFATDRQHAIKIANEKRFLAIAEGRME